MMGFFCISPVPDVSTRRDRLDDNVLLRFAECQDEHDFIRVGDIERLFETGFVDVSDDTAAKTSLHRSKENTLGADAGIPVEIRRDLLVCKHDDIC